MSNAIARFGRGDLAESARDLGKILSDDKKAWQQEILSGATRPQTYEHVDNISCFLHMRDARTGGNVFRLEVLGGLPEGMPDPVAVGQTRVQAERRLRWALAAWLMHRRGGRMDADAARERAKRASIYIADAIKPAA